MIDEWFYIEDGARRGPISKSQLLVLLSTKLPRDTMVWRVEAAAWSPATETADLLDHVPPPLPPLLAASPRSGRSPRASAQAPVGESVATTRPSVAKATTAAPARSSTTVAALTAGLILLVAGGLFIATRGRAPAGFQVIPLETAISKAEQGDVAAQHSLGRRYESGRGATQSYAEAATWYRRAAAQGSAGAQFDLAGLYMEGKGVPQDEVEAASWYQKAADQGFRSAQRQLGMMCARGQGVPKDEILAAVWIRKAAEQGDVDAQLVLSEMYRVGQGVARSQTEASYWLQRADEQKRRNERMKSVLVDAFSETLRR